MLLYASGSFLQVLEGDEAAIGAKPGLALDLLKDFAAHNR
jgi:hypothetical protein